MQKLKIDKYLIYFGVILFAIFLLRLPSLFEPFWYGDEGIFAAVARNLNLGGILYQTAWDNKPPLIYLTYSSIFKFFGVSMFNIHLAATIAVLITATLIYCLVKLNYGPKRALVAMSIFGLISFFRVFEGNLALTEIFMTCATTAGMFLAVRNKFNIVSLFSAGFLFAIASLYKQVGAFEAAACGIYLIFISRNFFDFFKKGVFLTLGFCVPYIFTLSYFLRLGLVSDYIFAAYTYYKIYLNESPQYAIFINILKYSPVVLSIGFAFYKWRTRSISVYNLFILWLSFSFLGSYFSGRAYGHYMIQALPPLSIVLATTGLRRNFKRVSLGFAGLMIIGLVLITRLLFSNIFTWDPQDQIYYYQNFINLVSGRITIDTYNDYFDKNVNSIMALKDFLAVNHANGKTVYIWGDIAWLYAISNVWNPTKYVTSFHVFGVPSGKGEVAADLVRREPIYIIRRNNSIGYFDALEKLIGRDYTLVSTVGDSEIFVKK